MKNAFLIFFLFLVLKSFNGFAQAGVLDSSFGINGISTFFPANFNNIILQSDGKILIGGAVADTPSFNYRNAVFRYKINGSLDSSFGINGVASVEVGLGSNNDQMIALQQDGKIVEGGTCVNNDGNWSFNLVRFDSTGKIDISFNVNGIVFTSFNTIGIADYGYDVTVQPDGKIIQVGMGQDNTHANFFAMVRYNTDGSLDNSFGNNGKMLITIGNPYPYAQSVIVQPDGKILVCGYSLSAGTAPGCFAVLRLNEDGTLDTNFGNKGKVTTYFGDAGSNGTSYDDDEGYAMALQTDGKILVTGASYLGTDTFRTIPIARYNPDGSLDNSFGNGGKVRTRIPNNKSATSYSITIQQDGKIIIGGGCCNTVNYSDQKPAIIRYYGDGSLDNTFGAGGIVTFDSLSKLTYWVYGLAMQPDGRILAAGGFGLWRLISNLNTGILNFSSPQNPLFIYPNPISTQATLQYTLTQNESISITLTDMLGRQVQTFFTNQTRTQGEHTEQLQLSNALAAGNYILSISNGHSNQGVKVTVVR